ncbi:Pkinase domain-containing protein/GUB_WAK_bind domain-containing protein/WAK_assoc domain-containing protein [Cephalotus follicularis]|uniref:non-specific serine/threonine protein kinase n=1 Tax=Cephalotus follicularis TaxID=3775 RepID=A0A1Q3BDG1_CEPFO|nr:Pkinase domain-containing protein/GUB_WAK_bind domain-containing protein/WAK_assoc domain-containing protein [Cephalotus follicularis]
MTESLGFGLTSSFSINLYIFSLLLLARRALCTVDPRYLACFEPKTCGDGQIISFPFYIEDHQEPFCGYPGFNISCNNNGNPVLKLSDDSYIIQQIFYKNQSLRVTNAAVFNGDDACVPPIQNISIPDDRFELINNQANLILLYNCSASLPENIVEYKVNCTSNQNNTSAAMAMFEEDPHLKNASSKCTKVVVAPVEDKYGNKSDTDIGELLRNGFWLNWIASDCSICDDSGGKCGFNSSTYHFQCYCPDRPHALHCTPGKQNFLLKLKLGIGIGGSAIIILIFSIYFIQRHYKIKYSSPEFLSKNTLSNPSSKSDLVGGTIYFGVPIFSHRELAEATNNFDSEKELGDGGYGIVYYGKLRDGREVAVKSLFENNYRRVEQFLNEIEILTRLQHKNLVTLYGCTSRRSRDLLLVYEYIPNGTVADHLHGERVKPSSLTWPIRMNIAIETASALAYLHASDIIHRDVKTNNILLDNNFSVKVADFGLSRLFPNDVTHISTVPQGTPGYVDPEYQQCYQLTDRSDVYSFGVVLIELISSMPAVDIARHRHEINLSNFAINKIQKCAFDELIDPSLGHQSDEEVRRMTTSIAELAFRCLQQDKEMRPSMYEVLEELQNIQRGDYKLQNLEQHGNNDGVQMEQPPPPSPECDEVSLLKNLKLVPPSPNSVTGKWISCDSTPNTSDQGLASLSM